MKEYATVFFTAFDKGISVPAVLAEFTLFGMEFSIRWYGVLIAAGFALALLICTRIAKKQGVNVDHFFDAVIFGTIAAIVGARLYFVVFNLDYYSKNPGEILKISNGGLAIYGAIIGALIAGYIVCRIRKESFLKVFDIAAVGFLVGQGIGRWGNFTNQEAFGTNTTLPWGMTSSKISNYIIFNQDEFASGGFEVDPFLPVHPTFLYESVWCLIGAVVLYVLCTKYKKFDGQIILCYGIWYGLERTIVEGLRTDSLYIGSSNIRVSQVLSAAIALLSLIVLIYRLIRIKKQVTEETASPNL